MYDMYDVGVYCRERETIDFPSSRFSLPLLLLLQEPLQTRAPCSEKVSVDLLGCHHVKWQIFEIGTA